MPGKGKATCTCLDKMEQQIRLLLLLLLALQASQAFESSDSDADEADFTPEQLAKAKDNLARLFDDKLDSNSDGKVTRQELISWLAEANRQQTERDLDETWQAYNLTKDGEDSFLDWETHAARRAAAVANPAADEDNQREEARKRQQAEFHAEVKRAIDEASKETGIDKAGIKVGVPEAPTPAEPTKTEDNKDGEQQQQLALELGRDRRRWEAADIDGDGRLSRKEFAAFALAEGSASGAGGASPSMRRVLALEALERMDSDGDGRVSLAEFLAGAPPQSPESAAADSKEDKTADEDAKNFKDVWDVNKDDYIDAEEMEKMLDYLDSAVPGGKEADDEAEWAEEADRLIRTADSDGDGSLSKAEVLSGLKEFAGSAATDYGGSVGIHDEL